MAISELASLCHRVRPRCGWRDPPCQMVAQAIQSEHCSTNGQHSSSASSWPRAHGREPRLIARAASSARPNYRNAHRGACICGRLERWLSTALIEEKVIDTPGAGLVQAGKRTAAGHNKAFRDAWAVTPWTSGFARIRCQHGHLHRTFMQTDQNISQPLWTIADVAKHLSVSVNTVYNWRAKQQGPPSLNLPGVVRYLPSAVVAWCNSFKEATS